MFSTILKYITIIGVVSGFSAPTKPAVMNFKYVGDISPTGYFDPLSLSSKLSDESVKYAREAELQHGRVAMLSMIALPLLDKCGGDTLAIDALYKLPLAEQIPFWTGVGCFEFARMGAGWRNPFMEKNANFKLEESYQPGNLFKLKEDQYTKADMEKELSNGRLAMMASLGYIAQEFVTGQHVV
jgi:hypothetical protein